MPVSAAQTNLMPEQQEGVDSFEIHPSLRQSIRDAILFGNVRELDDVLNIIAIDEDFPEKLRSGIEALRHFRAAYSKGGEMEAVLPSAQKKKILLENAWGAELLQMLGK